MKQAAAAAASAKCILGVRVLQGEHATGHLHLRGRYEMSGSDSDSPIRRSGESEAFPTHWKVVVDRKGMEAASRIRRGTTSDAYSMSFSAVVWPNAWGSHSFLKNLHVVHGGVARQVGSSMFCPLGVES